MVPAANGTRKDVRVGIVAIEGVVGIARGTRTLSYSAAAGRTIAVFVVIDPGINAQTLIDAPITVVIDPVANLYLVGMDIRIGIIAIIPGEKYAIGLIVAARHRQKTVTVPVFVAKRARITVFIDKVRVANLLGSRVDARVTVVAVVAAAQNCVVAVAVRIIASGSIAAGA